VQIEARQVNTECKWTEGSDIADGWASECLWLPRHAIFVGNTKLNEPSLVMVRQIDTSPEPFGTSQVSFRLAKRRFGGACGDTQ